MPTFSDYLILILLAVAVTLPLEFIGRMGIYGRYRATLIALSTPILVFIAWDIVFASTDLWNFSKKHTYDLRIFSLPIEEILFFIFIPLAALLTYHAVSHMNKRPGFANKFYWIIFALLYFSLGYAFHKYRLMRIDLNLPMRTHPYYFVCVLIVLILFVYWISQDETRITFLKSKNYFFTILICALFMIPFNGYLTRLTDPVVTYRANLGPRIYFDMPFEDVIYGWVLLTWVLLRYHLPKLKP